MDDLIAECEDDLLVSLGLAFGAPPKKVEERRRVILVAPSFDAPSVLAAQYVAKALEAVGVELRLLRAELVGKDDFHISWWEGPPIGRSWSLPVGFAETLRGRLYYVLEEGPRPVLWNVGRRDPEGRLKPLKGTALSRRAIRVRNNYLVPVRDVAAVSLDRHNTVWRHRTKPGRQAKILGILTLQDGPFVAFVRFRDGQFRRCQIQPVTKFDKEWLPDHADLQSWRDIATQAEAAKKA